jgi:hypothetical protein
MDEVEEFTVQDLHLTLAGDTALGLSYLPYAKAKILELLREGDEFQVRQYTPQTGVLVRVRLVDDQRFVHIEAVRGCTDRPGFLLSRRAQAYDALYTDGTLENINPIEGTPRPVPDPARRTKGYKVPQDLRREGLARLSASKYSGLMRLAVGCHHAAGKESPFRHEHQITHGIVKKTVRVSDKDVDKYWVVEIRQEGVFAAPIANTGKCCDSWDVSTYMPRPPSAPGEPLLPKPEKLSLRTRFVSGEKRVKQLVSTAQMAVAYGSGSPFYAAHGWAFSASGAEAQAVVQSFVSVPAMHYECSRWKITFEFAGGDIAGTLTQIEANRPATFKRNSVVWVPISSGRWEGSFGSGIETPNPITTYPSQNAPVAVYYAGETEKVLRWRLTHADVPADFKGRVFGPTFIPGPAWTGCPNSEATPVFGLLGTYDLSTITDGYNISAHTARTFGFYCDGFFSHVGDEAVKSVDRVPLLFGTVADGPIETTPNTYDLDPPCYYFNESGVLQTRCTSTFEYQGQGRVIWWWDRFSGTESSGNTSSVVLFAEEREAFLGVNARQFSESGYKITVLDGPSWICRAERKTKVDGGLCPWENRVFESSNTTPCNTGITALLPTRTDDPDYTSSSSTGEATLALADHTDSSGNIEGNYSLGTFLECNPTSKPYAESNVRAMHGNLYYADVKLTPPEQRDNRVYLLDDEQVVNGGFLPPADPAGFVGKA